MFFLLETSCVDFWNQFFKRISILFENDTKCSENEIYHAIFFVLCLLVVVVLLSLYINRSIGGHIGKKTLPASVTSYQVMLPLEKQYPENNYSFILN